MNSESRFVDKVVSRLNQRLNKLSNGSKKQREMDLYENVLSLAQNYVSDEIGKYGIEEYGDLYYKIVRRWIRDNYGNGKVWAERDESMNIVNKINEIIKKYS